MGIVIEGRWTDENRSIEAGAFVRRASAYADDIGPDVTEAIGSEPGRFHLIASLSCPWSHRTIIVRAIKGLAANIPDQVAGGTRVEGYPVNGGDPWQVPGGAERIVHLHELYTLANPGYTGRATVPVLWDSRTRRIVSNESAKIMRAFDAVASVVDGLDFTLVPENLRHEIDALNVRLHDQLSNAVYRAGLARRQDAYDEAEGLAFATLDDLETRLSERRYLFGATITETDWSLFATLVRFDSVYHTHFRCTRRRLIDYPALWAYARDLYAWRGISETVDFQLIREGYYRNDGSHNPYGIVAAAPDADWTAPHGRETLGPAELNLRAGGTNEIKPRTLRTSAVVPQ